MKDSKIEIAEFLLKDTLSLRNEVKYTELAEMVHPLTYSANLKKHPQMNLIPVMEKYQDDDLKELFFRLIE